MHYNYDCKNESCLYEWETEQRITEDAHKECPKCHQQTARRLITGSNFVLAPGGCGWAKNSYSSK